MTAAGVEKQPCEFVYANEFEGNELVEDLLFSVKKTLNQERPEVPLAFF